MNPTNPEIDESKRSAMGLLNITDHDLLHCKNEVLEKCFCVSLLSFSPEMIQKATTIYLGYRNLFYPKEEI